MTEAVVWLVLWILLAFVGAWIIYAAFAFAGVGIAAATDKIWPAPTLIVVGLIGAGSWFVFAVVQTALQLIDVVQIPA